MGPEHHLRAIGHEGHAIEVGDRGAQHPTGPSAHVPQLDLAGVGQDRQPGPVLAEGHDGRAAGSRWTGESSRVQLPAYRAGRRVDQIDIARHGDGGQVAGRVEGEHTRIRPGQGLVPGHRAGRFPVGGQLAAYRYAEDQRLMPVEQGHRLTIRGRLGRRQRALDGRVVEGLAHGIEGVGRRRYLESLAGHQDGCLGVCREQVLALSGQRPGAGRGLGGDGLAPGDEGEDQQGDGHRANRQPGHGKPSLATQVRLPTGQQVGALQFGRWRVGIGLGRGQPALRGRELTAPEQETAVTSLPVPLGRLDQPSGVLPAVLEIGVDGHHDPIDGALELAVVEERDPVALGDGGWDLVVGNDLVEHRDDALAESSGVVHLVPAVGRRQGCRADDEDKCLRLFDGPSDGVGEDFAVGNGVEVQPHVFAVCGKRIVQACYEVAVLPRVGEEDVRHVEPTLVARRPSLMIADC